MFLCGHSSWGLLAMYYHIMFSDMYIIMYNVVFMCLDAAIKLLYAGLF